MPLPPSHLSRNSNSFSRQMTTGAVVGRGPSPRQRHVKTAASSEFGLHPDAASLLLDDAFGKYKPRPRAGHVAMVRQAAKRHEDARPFFARNARPVVGEAEDIFLVPFRAPADCDLSGTLSMNFTAFDSRFVERLAQPRPISAHPRQVGADNYFDFLFGDLRPQLLDGLVKDAADGKLIPFAGRVQRDGRFQQLVDRCAHPKRALARRLDQLFALRREFRWRIRRAPRHRG